MSAKEQAIRAIQELPDDADLQTVCQKLDFIRAVDEGLAQVPSGKSLTPEEVRLELSLKLYQDGALSPFQAADLAGLNRWDFGAVAKARGINTPYTLEMVEEDFANGGRR